MGIPTTTVARTLFDLAAVLNENALENALHEAEILRLVDLRAIETLLRRYPRRAGTPNLRRALAKIADDTPISRNELEQRFRELVVAANIPRPVWKPTLELDGMTIEPDCLWREQRLIVELDGRAVHLTRRAFEADRARDRKALAAGWRVVRITWRQLRDEPDAVVADLRRLLA